MVDEPGDLSGRFHNADNDTSVFAPAIVNKSGVVAIGKIYIHDTDPLPTPEDSTLFGYAPLEFAKLDKTVQEAIETQYIAEQTERFEEASKLFVQTYQDRYESVTDGRLAVELEDDISLQSQVEFMMAKDALKKGGEFNDRIPSALKAGKSIERAVYDAFAEQIKVARKHEMLEHMVPQYEIMREVMLRHLHPEKTIPVLEDAPDGAMIYCNTLAPSEVMGLVDAETGKPRFAGVVAKTGSARAHAPTMARALGVPYAIVDADGLPLVKNGYKCVIDSAENSVVMHPSKALLDEYERQQTVLDEQDAQLAARGGKSRNAKTLDKTQITFLSNFGASPEVSAFRKAHVSGIGLYRTEIAENMREESVGEFSKDQWKKIFRANIFACSDTDGKPVSMTVRTLDIAGDKAGRFADKSPEAKAKTEEEATARQIQALLELNRDLKAEGHKGKIKIMIPMIESPAHMKDWQDYADRMAEELECDPLKLGCMGEVPALFNKLDDLDVSFMSIGSNDLINGYLQTDRYHANSSELYDPTEPSFLEAVGKAVDFGEEKHIPISICGDMASDPRYTVLAVGAGVRTLSTGIASAHIIKEMVRRIDTAEAEALFEVLQNTSSRTEREALLDSYNELRLGLNRDGQIDIEWDKDDRSAFSFDDIPSEDPGVHHD